MTRRPTTHFCPRALRSSCQRRRRWVLVLALVSALTGCVSPAPTGPLVEYRAGLTSITQSVKCPGTYVLCSEQPDSPPLAEHHLTKGERVGFRREDDGSVSAVAPGYTIPLPPGAYRWEVVHTSVRPWHKRVWDQTRQRAVAVGETTAVVVGVSCLVVLGVSLWLALAYAQNQADQAEAQNP